MPLSLDEKINKTAEDLVHQLQSLFGSHPGYRPAHARGILINGTFTPTTEAAKLSVAPMFNSISTSVTVRFSSSTGLPEIPDTDPSSNPRGMAVRFNLSERKHTDVIAHSTPYFPVRTGAEFLEMLRAIAASPPEAPSPKPIENFLGANPSALAFVQAPKPFPSSFAKEAYYGVTALKFTNKDGRHTYFRYRIVPNAGLHDLDELTVKTKDPNYLFEEIKQAVPAGNISFRLLAQIAEEGDVTDDATVHWPETRKLVDLGTIKLETLEGENNKHQKHMIYDPIPRVEGVEASDDPLLEMRAAVYLISGRERRAAPES